MTLPVPDLPGILESAPKMLFDEVAKQLARILRKVTILITDADIDAAGTFRKKPAVIRYNFLIKYHFDMVRLERHAFPPAHDGLDQMLRSTLAGEARMCTVGDDRIGSAPLPSIGAAKTNNTVASLQEVGGFEIGEEIRSQRLRPLQQQMIKNPPVADNRDILRAAQRHVMAT